jgi:hypothetical protein
MLNPGCDAMMVAPTMPMFWRFMQPTWEKVCPRELRIRHRKREKYYQLVGGRRVWYGSAEDPESLEGDNLAALWGDEVRYWRKASWLNFTRRLREERARVLLGIATSTPAPGWMEEYFPDDNSKKGRQLFRISTRENEKHLGAGYIEQLEQTYSAEQIKSIIDGLYDVLEGQVYKAYSPGVHLVDWRVDPKLKTLVFMDFGVRRSSVLFAQETGDTWATPLPDGRVVPPGSLVVFDELQLDELPTAKAIPLIRARLTERGIKNVAAVHCDPAGNSRDIATGMPSVHLLRAEFGNVVKYTTNPKLTFIPNGIDIVRGRLAPKLGEPTLYFDKLLSRRKTRMPESDYSRGIIPAFRGYSYPEARDGRPISDHPVKDGVFEHVMDALRYGCINALSPAAQKAAEILWVN